MHAVELKTAFEMIIDNVIVDQLLPVKERNRNIAEKDCQLYLGFNLMTA